MTTFLSEIKIKHLCILILLTCAAGDYNNYFESIHTHMHIYVYICILYMIDNRIIGRGNSVSSLSLGIH